LKEENDLEVQRRAGGRLFHARGLVTANARSPVDARRVGGTTRSDADAIGTDRLPNVCKFMQINAQTWVTAAYRRFAGAQYQQPDSALRSRSHKLRKWFRVRQLRGANQKETGQRLLTAHTHTPHWLPTRQRLVKKLFSNSVVLRHLILCTRVAHYPKYLVVYSSTRSWQSARLSKLDIQLSTRTLYLPLFTIHPCSTGQFCRQLKTILCCARPKDQRYHDCLGRKISYTNIVVWLQREQWVSGVVV